VIRHLLIIDEKSLRAVVLEHFDRGEVVDVFVGFVLYGGFGPIGFIKQHDTPKFSLDIKYEGLGFELDQAFEMTAGSASLFAQIVGILNSMGFSKVRRRNAA